jgi:hypothetical protein
MSGIGVHADFCPALSSMVSFMQDAQGHTAACRKTHEVPYITSMSNQRYSCRAARDTIMNRTVFTVHIFVSQLSEQKHLIERAAETYRIRLHFSGLLLHHEHLEGSREHLVSSASRANMRQYQSSTPVSTALCKYMLDHGSVEHWSAPFKSTLLILSQSLPSTGL